MLSVRIRAVRGGRAQFYSVSKKRQGMSTKAEGERWEVAEEIKYVGIHTIKHLRYPTSAEIHDQC